MTTDDEPDFADVRRALDAVPAPAVAPADVAAIYHAALDRQARSARRWKVATASGALVAAGLLLAAVLPKLEVRFAANEFAVRWGPADPPPAAPTPARVPTPYTDPQFAARVNELDARVRDLGKADAELRELKELLLTVAADVSDRDERQKETIAALTRRLLAFEAASGERFRQAEQTNAALYTLITDKPTPEGVNP
jgi:hypothetical protein